MTRKAEMTVLADNAAGDPLENEWGLSILITFDGRKILLDTGASGAFARNARLLGEDLAGVDFGVLSHAHYDHADGMAEFFALNRSAPFFVREGVRENCWAIKEGKLSYIGIRRGLLKEYEDRIRYVSGVYEAADGVWLIPHRKADYSSAALRSDLYTDFGRAADDFSHEQSLVLDTEKGLIVFNSCSHTGMTNILEDVREMLGRSDVFAYVGGLHLYKMTDEELKAVCAELRGTSVEHILTGHCTGEHAYEMLRSELGERIERFYPGFRT
ncbi:MAG: MBL fold metallo-hydrolase [Oscillospiraceae bacterium]|nr:MBL fold metallo-hydrolase [Oscillospiraceae bacterium]